MSKAIVDALKGVVEAFETLVTAYEDGGADEEDSKSTYKGKGASGGKHGGAKGAVRRGADDVFDEDEADEPPVKASKGKPAKSAGKAGKKATAAVDFEDVKAAFVNVVESKGAATAKKLLKNLGVAKLGELEEDNYADALAQAKALTDDDDDGDNDEDLFGD